MTTDKDPNLSHLANGLNDPARKLEAIELWNKLIGELLITQQFVKMTKNGFMPVKLHYDKIRKGVEAIQAIEVTKQRMIVDRLIEELKFLEQQHNSTSIIRIARRAFWRGRIEALKTALLLVVNTSPEGITVKPAEEGSPKPATK